MAWVCQDIGPEPEQHDIDADIRREDGGARRIVAGTPESARFIQAVISLNDLKREWQTITIDDVINAARFWAIDDQALGKNCGFTFRLRELFGWSRELPDPLD